MRRIETKRIKVFRQSAERFEFAKWDHTLTGLQGALCVDTLEGVDLKNPRCNPDRTRTYALQLIWRLVIS